MSSASIKIQVQTEDFDHAIEYQNLTENQQSAGAVVTFTGLVRDMNLDNQVTGLYLEHYPVMTEKSLMDIAQQANQRWQLGKITIIHRVGSLALGDQIVFVGVTSKHRKSAFESCEFLIDFLKTSAPFWKKETSKDKDYWIEARSEDSTAAKKWG